MINGWFYDVFNYMAMTGLSCSLRYHLLHGIDVGDVRKCSVQKYFFFSFTLYPAYSGNLVKRHSVLIKTKTSVPHFLLNIGGIELRTSTPRLASLPNRENENIKGQFRHWLIKSPAALSVRQALIFGFTVSLK